MILAICVKWRFFQSLSTVKINNQNHHSSPSSTSKSFLLPRFAGLRRRELECSSESQRESLWISKSSSSSTIFSVLDEDKFCSWSQCQQECLRKNPILEKFLKISVFSAINGFHRNWIKNKIKRNEKNRSVHWECLSPQMLELKIFWTWSLSAEIFTQ